MPIIAFGDLLCAEATDEPLRLRMRHAARSLAGVLSPLSCGIDIHDARLNETKWMATPSLADFRTGGMQWRVRGHEKFC